MNACRRLNARHLLQKCAHSNAFLWCVLMSQTLLCEWHDWFVQRYNLSSCCEITESLKYCRLRWNTTWNALSLKQRKSSITDSCVSRCLVFRNGTETVANWNDHPHTYEGRQEGMQLLLRHLSPQTSCRSVCQVPWKNMSEIIERMPEDT